jgi:hypothetical protein
MSANPPRAPGELADEIERRFADGRYSFADLAIFTKACLPDILAALRAPQGDGAEARRSARAPAAPADAPWPAGCIKPNSCSRHRQCMYAGSVKQCRHFGQNLTQAVETAVRDREWAAAGRQNGGGSATQLSAQHSLTKNGGQP